MSYRQKISTGITYSTSHLGALDVYSYLRGCLVKSQVAILLYHKTTSSFEEQVLYLTRRFEVLPLSKLVSYISEKKPLPKKTAVITFDDGYKDNYINAYPVLLKYNAPATIFLTTGYIGTSRLFWWEQVEYLIHNSTLQIVELDELGIYSLASESDKARAVSRITMRLKELSEDRKNYIIDKLIGLVKLSISFAPDKARNLSWDEVREMDRNGISFGAHTVTHPLLTKVSREKATYEITQSKKDIENQLGKTVTAFCYPNGDFNTETIRLVKEAGFQSAVTLIPRLINSNANLYKLERISGGWDIDSFKFCLSGLYPDLKSMLGQGLLKKHKGS